MLIFQLIWECWGETVCLPLKFFLKPTSKTCISLYIYQKIPFYLLLKSDNAKIIIQSLKEMLQSTPTVIFLACDFTPVQSCYILQLSDMYLQMDWKIIMQITDVPSFAPMVVIIPEDGTRNTLTNTIWKG